MEWRRLILAIEGMPMIPVIATTDYAIAARKAAMRGGPFRSKSDAPPGRGGSADPRARPSGRGFNTAGTWKATGFEDGARAAARMSCRGSWGPQEGHEGYRSFSSPRRFHRNPKSNGSPPSCSVLLASRISNPLSSSITAWRAFFVRTAAFGVFPPSAGTAVFPWNN